MGRMNSGGASDISGSFDDRFSAVAAEFAKNFVERGEVGASLYVLWRGEPIIDLWGGLASQETREVWRSDTLVNFYSVGKAFTALTLLRCIDQGLIGLDDPIASVWPEFSAEGKGGATIRHALCHRAGVPAIRKRLSNDDLWQWEVMADALAQSAPWWDPGTRHGYHTNTYGHLIGEIVRRLTNLLPGAHLAALTEDVGADVSFGVPQSDRARCADVIWAGGSQPIEIQEIDLERNSEASMALASYFNPPGYSSMGVVNSARWRSAEIPSTNGHGSAEGVARLYGGLLEPGRFLTPDLLAEATKPQSTGFCPILGEEATFGLGFKPTSSRRPFGTSLSSFGHFGTGGAVGFADPENGIAFGYVMNHVIPRWQSSRNRALIDSLYVALAS